MLVKIGTTGITPVLFKSDSADPQRFHEVGMHEDRFRAALSIWHLNKQSGGGF